MSVRGRFTRGLALGLSIPVAMFGWNSASAQSGDPLPRSRTGQGAEQPELPPFAEPAPGLLAIAPSANSGSGVTGSIALDDVQVIATDGEAARFIDGWAPLEDSSAGLKLSFRSGDLLDASWIRRQFTENGLTGPSVALDRVSGMIQLINLAYLQNGYVNSGILLDGNSGSTLKLRLVSGQLTEQVAGDGGVVVSWKDNSGDGLSAHYVRNRMPSAREKPLNLVDVERDFRLLADDPAIRSVNADLRPGAKPGEATLAITVDPHSRGDFYTGYANNRSPSVGGERFSAGGYLRSLFRPGDTLSAEYGTAKGLNDFTASYAVPLFGPKWSFRVRGGANEAAVVETVLLPLDIQSKEWSVEGGLTRKILARPLTPNTASRGFKAAQDASIGLFVGHRQVRSKLLGQPFSFSPGSVNGRTEYTTLQLAGDYTRRTQNAVLALSFTGTMGLDGTRSSIPGLVTPDRNFLAGLFQANFARRLTKSNLELRLRFAGQIANGILYSPERFSAGGIETVRGFRENLALADEAAVGSIELAQPFTIGGSREANYAPGHFTLSAFVDGAVVHNKAGTPVAQKTFGSGGGALLWAPARWLSARVTYAKAFKRIDFPMRRDLQDKGVAFRVVFHPLAIFGRRK